MPTILIPHDTATGYVSAKSGIKSLGLASGLAGAAAASRYAGATASGAPASGAFLLGDWTIDQTGAIHVCSVAGTVGSGAVFTRVGGVAVTAVTFAESTASPNDTVYVDSITAAGSTTNVDLALRPKGTGALTAHVANGTATGGDKRGANATDWQTSRGAAEQVASGAESVIGGGSSNKVQTYGSTVAGGSSNVAATGTMIAIGGGQSNTVTATYGAVAGGYGNTMSSGYGFAAGNANAVSNNYSTAIGDQNTASGYTALALGGMNTVSGDYASVPGGYQALAATHGKLAFSGGKFTANGDSQYGLTVLRGTTTLAGTARLTADGASAGAANIVNLANNRVFLMKVNLVATDTAVPHTKGLIAEYSVLIRRGAAAANTVVADQMQVVYLADASILDVVITVSADTDYGGLNLTVTGSASTDLRWVATVQSAEAG